MKKQALVLIIILLCAAVLLTACGNKESVQSQAEPAVENQPPAVTEYIQNENTDSLIINETAKTEAVDTSLLPQIKKSPDSETINKGYAAVYIAEAENYDTVAWYLTSPDGAEKHPAEEANTLFKGVTAEGADTTMLTLSNCSTLINGWLLTAEFTNAYGSSVTEEAELYVAGTDSGTLILEFKPSEAGDGSGTAVLKAGAGDRIKYFVYNDMGEMLEAGECVGVKTIAVTGENGEGTVYVYAELTGRKNSVVTGRYQINKD